MDWIKLVVSNSLFFLIGGNLLLIEDELNRKETAFVAEDSRYNLFKGVKKILEENPKFIGDQFSTPQIKRLFSDFTKRYSEYHRIAVWENGGGSDKFHFWIKIVKNQTADTALRKIYKEYHFQKELWNFFNSTNGSVQLSTCQPLSVIDDVTAIITKECSGVLFNTYLRYHISIISGKRILQHCRNIGLWIRAFHEYFRKQDPDPLERDDCISRYKKLYASEPDDSLAYLTFCHNDYTPRNIFVDDNVVEVLDFVAIGPGIPDEDVTLFQKYIKNAKFNGLYSKTFKRKMILQFRAGYDSYLPSVMTS